MRHRLLLHTMITVRHCRRWRRGHFHVHHTNIGSGSGGFRRAAGGAENALGLTDLQGILDGRI